MKTIEALNELLELIKKKIAAVDEQALKLLHPDNPTATYYLENSDKLLVRELGFLFQIVNLICYALEPESKKKQQLKDPIDAFIVIINNIAPLFKSAMLFGLKSILNQLRLSEASAKAIDEWPEVQKYLQVQVSIEEIAELLADRNKLAHSISNLFSLDNILPNKLAKYVMNKLLFTAAAQESMSKAFSSEELHTITEIDRSLESHGFNRVRGEFENGNYFYYDQIVWSTTDTLRICQYETATKQAVMSEVLIDFYLDTITPWMQRFFSDQEIINELSDSVVSSLILSFSIKRDIKSEIKDTKKHLKKLNEFTKKAAGDFELGAKIKEAIVNNTDKVTKLSKISVKDHIYENLAMGFDKIREQLIPDISLAIKQSRRAAEKNIFSAFNRICMRALGANFAQSTFHIKQRLDMAMQKTDYTNHGALQMLSNVKKTLQYLQKRISLLELEIESLFDEMPTTQLLSVRTNESTSVVSQDVKFSKADVGSSKVKPKKIECFPHSEKEKFDSKKYKIIALEKHEIKGNLNVDIYLDIPQQLESIKQYILTQVRNASSEIMMLGLLLQTKLMKYAVNSDSVSLARNAPGKLIALPNPLPLLANKAGTFSLTAYEFYNGIPVDIRQYFQMRILQQSNHPYQQQRDTFKIPALCYQSDNTSVESVRHWDPLFDANIAILQNKLNTIFDTNADDGQYVVNLAFYYQIVKPRLTSCFQILQSSLQICNTQVGAQHPVLSSNHERDPATEHHSLISHTQIPAILPQLTNRLAFAQTRYQEEVAKLDAEVKSKITKLMSEQCDNAAVNLYVTAEQTLLRYFDLRKKIVKYKIYDAGCALFGKRTDEQIRRSYAMKLSQKIYTFLHHRDEDSLRDLNRMIEEGQAQFKPRTKNRDDNCSRYQKSLHFALGNIKNLVRYYVDFQMPAASRDRDLRHQQSRVELQRVLIRPR